jgi:tripartite-type tricarboxylate transporter receptor subunit TctC
MRRNALRFSVLPCYRNGMNAFVARTAGLLVSVVMLIAATESAAAGYPDRPVRVVAPYSPGGGVDFTSRVVTQKLATALGQTFVVDNRAGAASIIGTQIVAAAQPDGYTLLWTDNAFNVNPLVFKDAKYDPLKDFETIAQIGSAPQMLVASLATPANNLRELLALPRSQTARYAVGSSGLASVPHFTYERLRMQTGLALNHVPYKGSGAALADLVGGQIQLAMNSAAPCIPLVQAGRIKGLGVAATARLRQLPDVPTFNEAGLKDFTAAAWYGVFAPRGTPRAIVDLLHRELRKALASPDVGERFAAQALDIAQGSPEDFKRQLAAETERWKLVIKETGLKLE